MRIAEEEIFGPVLTAIPFHGTMRCASPTTSTTASPVTCGPATSAVPTGRPRSKPDDLGQLPERHICRSSGTKASGIVATVVTGASTSMWNEEHRDRPRHPRRADPSRGPLLRAEVSLRAQPEPPLQAYTRSPRCCWSRTPSPTRRPRHSAPIGALCARRERAILMHFAAFHQDRMAVHRSAHARWHRRSRTSAGGRVRSPAGEPSPRRIARAGRRSGYGSDQPSRWCNASSTLACAVAPGIRGRKDSRSAGLAMPSTPRTTACGPTSRRAARRR